MNYGKLSIGIAGVAVGVGLVELFLTSIVFGSIYIGFVLVASWVILMSYCRKCPHSNNGSCVHGIPKSLFEKLPYKKTGKYTGLEIGLTILSVLVVVSLPLIVLISQPIILTVYILLWIICAVMIRIMVCKNCYNRWCSLCPNRARQ